MEQFHLNPFINQQVAIQNVCNTNEYTKKFGLTLSEAEAKLLLIDRKDSLSMHQRVEFGEGILNKLIYTFCDSPYIYQENYTDMIGALQEIFYLYKNESLDEVTDDELLAYMKEEFDGVCQGSLEYLEDTSLEEFARKIRKGTIRFIGRYHANDEL